MRGARVCVAEVEAGGVCAKTHVALRPVNNKDILVCAVAAGIEGDAVAFRHQLHGVYVCDSIGVKPYPAMSFLERDEVGARRSCLGVDLDEVGDALDVFEEIFVTKHVAC